MPPLVSRSRRLEVGARARAYQIPPQAVIFPRDTNDIVLAMRLGSEPRFADIVCAVHRLVDDIQKKHGAEIEARFPKLNRCLTGYDLAHIRDEHGRFNPNSILRGSEGTLAFVAAAANQRTCTCSQRRYANAWPPTRQHRSAPDHPG